MNTASSRTEAGPAECAGGRAADAPWPGDPLWRRSSSCPEETCVEVCLAGDAVLMRDSKTPTVTRPIRFSLTEWGEFLGWVRDVPGADPG